MENLHSFLGSPVIGVVASYQPTGTTDVFIAGVTLYPDNTLEAYFPKGHNFHSQQLVTLHLDNRTGVDEYDADLRVYRTSYKGRVKAVISPTCILVEPLHFELVYGISPVLSYNAPEYSHAQDLRPDTALPISPLTELPPTDTSEADNKIGVLISRAPKLPHTTVLAFLSSCNDDIFIISRTNTLKSRLLAKNNNCHFAIDARAVFTYNQAIEWNYSIIEATAYLVPPQCQLFEQAREAFIYKNPWEVGFFSAPDIEMYHLQANKVILPV